MLRMLKAVISYFAQENHTMRPLGQEGRGRSRYIPGSLLVKWRVLDKSDAGEKTLAASEVIVAFMDEDMVRTSLMADLKRIFPPLPPQGATREYRIDVQSAVA